MLEVRSSSYFRFWLRDVGDTGYKTLDSTSPVAIDKWYHIGIWHSTTLDKVGIRVYDEDNDTVYNETSNHYGKGYILM